MQEIIKISQTVVGSKEVNSVNARDLHVALDIKKKFADWIKSQINRAGLQENIDFIMVSPKRESIGRGGDYSSKDYILTTNSAKHIAMMSQGQKAHEVRDYFIAVEEEYRAMQVQGGDNTLMLTQISTALNNMSEFMKVMVTTQEQIVGMMVRQESKQIENALTPAQLTNIKLQVNKAAKPLADVHRFTFGRAVKEVYSELNGRMGVFSYYQISPADYDEAMELLENFRSQKESELKNVGAKKDDDEMPQF